MSPDGIHRLVGQVLDGVEQAVVLGDWGAVLDVRLIIASAWSGEPSPLVADEVSPFAQLAGRDVEALEAKAFPDHGAA